MNCAFDKEKLTGYYDGELDAAEKAEVERHIASCSECLRELGELKSAAVLVKELPRLRAPRSIAEGISREIQTAGKVHSFAKVRRNLLWAASAAAGLLVVLNVIYFAGKAERSEPAMTRTASPAPMIGRSAPPPEEDAKLRQQGAAKDSAAKSAGDDAQLERGRRVDEERKNAFGAADGKKLDAAPDPKAPESVDREKASTANAAKREEQPRAASEPIPGAALPEKARPMPASKPQAPAAPPAPTARPAEVPADKTAQRKEVPEGLAGKLEESKAKKPAAPEPAAAQDAGPTHLTLASTQVAKSRAQVEETLRKMGALPPPPPPAMMKGAARSSSREETVYQLELTDSQIARLRAELEKPGTSMLVAGRPEDPVMAQYRRGGMFEGKKDGAGVASGGAAAPKKSAELKQPEAKADAKDKDVKEFEAQTGKAPAAEAGEKSAEPRRKVTLHFMEVPSIQTQPAGDALKK